MAKGAVRGRPGTARDSWRGSWRVALRSARREVGRSRGRSLLILLLIGLPVFGLSAAGVALASVSANADPVEAADGELFGQVARGGFRAMDRQRPDQVLLAQGVTRGSAWDQERVEATIGAPVLATATLPLTSTDGIPLDQPALVADGTDPLFRGRGQLVSGRWAAGPGEVTVTEVGIADGLPRSGLVSLSLGEDDRVRDLRVVGVAKAQAGQTQAAAVLHPSAAPEGTAWAWALDRTRPVPLDEALRWTDYGLSVMSRAVLLDPPPEDQPDGELVVSLVIAMLVLGVIIETAFLAGPAFAISTTRRQRSMALASAQGAGPADLRRQVLGYAVVLAAAAVGAVLGIGTGLAVAGYLRRRSLDGFLPLEVPWLPLLGIVLLAVLAAALAAWWPARGVTHLDTMSVLRGRSVSRPVRPGMPVVGGVMVAAGAVLAGVGAVAGSGGEYALVAAGALTFFGAVLMIPLLLVLAGRLAERLPTAARLAVRDATRQRGRSVPAVAAIAAAVALVVGLSTVTASSESAAQLNYRPQVPIGEGIVSLQQWGPTSTEPTMADPTDVRGALREALPSAEVWSIDRATAAPGVSAEQPPSEGLTGLLWAIYPPDCSVGQVPLGPAYGKPCGMGANTFGAGSGRGIAVLSEDALTGFDGLDESALQALSGGAVALPAQGAPGTEPHTIVQVPTISGRVTVLPGRDYEFSLQPSGELATGAVPAYMMDTPGFRRTFQALDVAAVMTSRTASTLGLPVGTDQLRVAHPDRALTEAEAATGKTAAEQTGASFYVERGFEGDAGAQRAIWIVLATLGLIALAATVIVTALMTTDNARDSAVLSAVGGTSRLRRRWASLYALVIAGLGALLGTLVGVGMGLACAWWTTNGRWGFDPSEQAAGGTISVSWPTLGALALLPLLGALIAWLSVRGTPHLLRPTI